MVDSEVTDLALEERQLLALDNNYTHEVYFTYTLGHAKSALSYCELSNLIGHSVVT